MTSLLFKKDQNELFNKQIDENREDLFIWNLVNVYVPCIIIIIPACFYAFLPEDRVTLQNLIFNGSFSLLGINILFSTSTFLINSFRLRDEKIEKQIYYLRIRLVVYLCALLILGTLIYLLQIAFNITTCTQRISILISFIVVFISMGIGRRAYLLKDELVGKSFNEDVQGKVSELQHSTDDLN